MFKMWKYQILMYNLTKQMRKIIIKDTYYITIILSPFNINYFHSYFFLSVNTLIFYMVQLKTS